MNRPSLAVTLVVAFAACSVPAAAADGPPSRTEVDRIVKSAQDDAQHAAEDARRDAAAAQREAAAAQREARAAVEQARREAAAGQREAAAAQREALAAHEEALASDLDFDGPTLAFFGNEFGTPREIVKNAPYTADAVNESVQVLPDGNRIVKRNVTRLARDTVGRTRQEKAGTRGATVYLFDPIDNRNYALDPQRKVAVRIPRVPSPPVPPTPLAAPLPPPVPPVAPVAPMAPVAPGAPLAATPPSPPTGYTPYTPHTPPTPATPVAPPVPGVGGAASASITQDGNRVVVRRGGDGRTADDVKVEIIRIGRDDRGSMAGLPPIAMPWMSEGKGEQKSLGTREFDGVKAEGTQTTHVIPAGAIGNEKPIVTTRERWFSPELQLVVFVRTVDPRAGETTYRLTNLRRGEPPAELFRVPSDYRTRGETRG